MQTKYTNARKAIGRTYKYKNTRYKVTHLLNVTKECEPETERIDIVAERIENPMLMVTESSEWFFENYELAGS